MVIFMLITCYAYAFFYFKSFNKIISLKVLVKITILLWFLIGFFFFSSIFSVFVSSQIKYPHFGTLKYLLLIPVHTVQFCLILRF